MIVSNVVSVVEQKNMKTKQNLFLKNPFLAQLIIILIINS